MEGYGCTELNPVVSANLPATRPAAQPQAGLDRPSAAGVAAPGIRTPTRSASSGEWGRGLILAKGPNVMQGYLGMLEKTAEVLIDGWYTTGDIGYLDRDGFLFITDRLSRFSKIGGDGAHGRVEETLQDLAMELSRGHEGAPRRGRAAPAIAVTAVEDEKKGEQGSSPSTRVTSLRCHARHEGLGETDLPMASSGRSRRCTSRWARSRCSEPARWTSRGSGPSPSQSSNSLPRRDAAR